MKVKCDICEKEINMKVGKKGPFYCASCIEKIFEKFGIKKGVKHGRK